MTRVAATYEEGTLRLDHPMAIENGSRVEVLVIERPDESARRAAAALAAIAALPRDGAQEPFSGEDHDRLLYPAPRIP